MSQNTSNKFLLLWLLFPIGLVVYLLSQNLTKAKPEKSIWILTSRYRKYANWIEAQAKHETGNYTSEVYKRANNLFGMKNANVRKQLGKEVEGDSYRHYKNVGESIRDYLLYLDHFGVPSNIGTAESYFQKLKDQKYFTDSFKNYFNGVRNFINVKA